MESVPTNYQFKIEHLQPIMYKRVEQFKSPLEKLFMNQETWRGLVGFHLVRHQIQMEMEGNMTVYGIPVERDESVPTGRFEALVKLSMGDL